VFLRKKKQIIRKARRPWVTMADRKKEFTLIKIVIITNPKYRGLIFNESINEKNNPNKIE